MQNVFWLFPIIFMLHELEEIIGFRLWFEKNKDVINKYNRLSKIYQNFSIEGFSVAVLEEYLLCIVITGVSFYFNEYIIWLGTFIAFSLHLFVHLIQSIFLRRYIPSFLSSVILLPISIVIIEKVIENSAYKPSYILIASILCTLVMLLNLIFVHKIMEKVTEMINISR